jgi:hypothetical protein
MRALAAVAAVLTALLGLVAGARRLLHRPPAVGVISDPDDETRVDDDGAVHSVQGADLTLPVEVVDRIWDPHHLERLARTYWRFLTRATLGLVRVQYTQTGRYVVFLTRPFTLLSFHAPEYVMDENVGIVRWRIRRGILVAQRGEDRDGYLEIEMRRCEPVGEGRVRVRVRVEVANFYPWLASGIAVWFYRATQSRIHVIVTHAFLRSLAKLDLADSRVLRFPPRPGGQRWPSRIARR